MNKLLFLLGFAICFSGFGQQTNHDSALEKIIGDACNCVESIDLFNRPLTEINLEVSQCIDKQVVAYQLVSKLTTVAVVENETEDKQSNDIVISFEKNSAEYQKAYKEIERELLSGCENISYVIGNKDQLAENSFSEHPEAVRYYSVGIEEAKDGNCERAIDYYKEAVRIDEYFAFAWDNMGICYRRLEMYEDAIRAYQKSLSVSPNGKMPLQNLAITYKYMGDYEKSIEAYHDMEAVFPGDPEVYYGLALIYKNHLGDEETALDYACQAYLKYAELKSPYRVDAEDLILILHERFMKDEKEEVFLRTLQKHDIGFN